MSHLWQSNIVYITTANLLIEVESKESELICGSSEEAKHNRNCTIFEIKSQFSNKRRNESFSNDSEKVGNVGHIFDSNKAKTAMETATNSKNIFNLFDS